MSQVHVERAIGLLATDEGLRSRFNRDPRAALVEMAEKGLELTECERVSIAALSPRELARFVRAIHPRLQRADLQGDCR